LAISSDFLDKVVTLVILSTKSF